MHPTSLELAVCLLDLADCESGFEEKSPQDFHEPHLDRLCDEFYEFKDRMIDPMIAAGLGDTCLENMFHNLEFVYLCERLGHGVSFTDQYLSDSPEYKIAELCGKVAAEQTYIEDGIYLGDDGRIYMYNYELNCAN